MSIYGTRPFDEVRSVFEEAYKIGLASTRLGKVADYIPELAKANGSSFGISMIDSELNSIELGECDKRFSMQSVSKVVLLAAALAHCGFEETFSHVMMEPSGDSFNSILKLDLADNRPYNPMINAGAIETVSLISGDLSFEDLLNYTRELCADPGIALDEAVYRSEFETGDRNRAIVYLLKSKGVLMGEPEKTLDLYFRMCSLSVSAKSLSHLGLVLANDGYDPLTGKQLIAPDHVRTVRVIMFTCGMYDYSGKFSVRVGVPSKSGVGGGLVCAAKGPMGIGFYGPALDSFGNSKATVKAMEHISHELELHMFR